MIAHAMTACDFSMGVCLTRASLLKRVAEWAEINTEFNTDDTWQAYQRAVRQWEEHHCDLPDEVGRGPKREAMSAASARGGVPRPTHSSGIACVGSAGPAQADRLGKGKRGREVPPADPTTYADVMDAHHAAVKAAGWAARPGATRALIDDWHAKELAFEKALWAFERPRLLDYLTERA